MALEEEYKIRRLCGHWETHKMTWEEYQEKIDLLASTRCRECSNVKDKKLDLQEVLYYLDCMVHNHCMCVDLSSELTSMTTQDMVDYLRDNLTKTYKDPERWEWFAKNHATLHYYKEHGYIVFTEYSWYWKISDNGKTIFIETWREAIDIAMDKKETKR